MRTKNKKRSVPAAALEELLKRYAYRVFWSDEDDEFVAVCLEFPSMSGLAKTQEQALVEVKLAVEGALEWIFEEGGKAPEPISTQKFKGNLSLRTTPEKHRELAMRAAESGVSINQYILSKLG